jgi:bifunctional non-homologous end joining protein LigD
VPVVRRQASSTIRDDVDAIKLEIDGYSVTLTNLRKVYFPKKRLNKGDLLRYYLAVAPVLLPHIVDRAMVMKRYPNGVAAKFFYMKRTPVPRPTWIETCPIEHGSGSIIDFPLVRDRASLLWLVNLGCIDLNPWYSLCSDPDKPLYLHFDMDPTEKASFSVVRKGALLVRDALRAAGMTPFVKTTGSRGVHIYVAIRPERSQREVWSIAKQIAQLLAKHNDKVLTSEYRIAKRPPRRVLVDYNQNAFGKTLASIYSVRANEAAAVSTPITWDELEGGCEPGDFTMENVPARIAQIGDLWEPLLRARGRFVL